ncbi:MAG: metalloprotease [Candidatus Nanohaloarchaea archaeon]|nr:metalloprotease [Candidatus Nanohaloarchaea archaeon]
MKIISGEGQTAYEHTSEEVRDLIVSAVALSFAFTLTVFGGDRTFSFVLQPSFLKYFLITGVVVGLSLVAKEMAQKGTSRALESYATYEIWPPGIVIAILSSFLGVVFAAVGGIVISSEYTERAGRWQINLSPQQMGIIASIGPLVNLTVGMGLVMLSPLVPMFGLERNIFLIGGEINALLALFAMVPFGPVDGKKVLRWNTVIWLFIVAMSLAVFALTRGWL